MHQKFKIVCIVQIFNEMETGMLPVFFENLQRLVDHVIVYDDGSTDGSWEFCLKRTPHVIRNTVNNFKHEVSHKKQMLTLANELGADFILSLDADEVLAINKNELETLCSDLIESGNDGIKFDFVNLWRSTSWRRVDNLFDEYKPVKLWKHQPLENPFPVDTNSLHQTLHPEYVKKVVERFDIKLLHLGFSTTELVVRKFITYKKSGQRGFLLDRFIDESNLKLKEVKIPERGLTFKVNNQKPTPIEVSDYIAKSIELQAKVLKPKFSIICLIYKDTRWLDFVYEQVQRYTDLSDKEFFFVANDATDEVKEHLRNNYIPHFIFENTPEHKQEHYINNVYRAYNYGVEVAAGDFVILINSDMAFTPDWFENLYQSYNGKTCVASRLVEAGKLAPGEFGIARNFGDDFSNYREADFLSYAKILEDKNDKSGGLFMPLLVRTEDFKKVGGYPEGNIIKGSDLFYPAIALPGADLVTGDKAFTLKLATIGIGHKTCFSSIVYHFQEGEKRSEDYKNASLESQKKIAVCNDIVTGTMGEKVLWDHLLELPQTIGVDFKKAGGKKEKNFAGFLKDNADDVQVIVQNASFLDQVDSSRYTIVFLQDDLRKMGNPSFDQEKNLQNASLCVTNSAMAAASYSEFFFEVIPVGVDDELFAPLDKAAMRSKWKIAQDKQVGIFVGALNEVKGWSKVKKCIEQMPDLNWIVVSKYEENFSHPNVHMFARIPHEELVELLNCADFFILGSAVETQCLAAIEAALCNLPILMNSVGIFEGMPTSDLLNLGVFDCSFEDAIVQLKQRNFSPRQTILKYPVSTRASKEAWYKLLTRSVSKVYNDKHYHRGTSSTSLVASPGNNYLYRLEFFLRRKILRRIIRRDYFFTIPEISIYLRDHSPKFLYTILKQAWKLSKRVRAN